MAKISSTVIAIDVPLRSYRQVILDYEEDLADWARSFQVENIILRSQKRNRKLEYKIPAKVYLSSTASKRRKNMDLIYTANTKFSPVLLRLSTQIMDSGGNKGIVRARDGLQVVMHDDVSTLFGINNRMERSTTWTRNDYWLPEDRAEFERAIRQELRDDGTNELLWTYRACDPERGFNDLIPGNWRKFVTKYRLYNGNDGEYYQVGECLEVSDIPDASALRLP